MCFCFYYYLFNRDYISSHCKRIINFTKAKEKLRYWCVVFDTSGDVIEVIKVRKTKLVVAQGVNMTVRNDGLIWVENILAIKRGYAVKEAQKIRAQYFTGKPPCNVCEMTI